MKTMKSIPHTQWTGEDWLDLRGANHIAQSLRDYWLERGYEVKVWVVQAHGPRDTAVAVRSDMVCGLPKDFRGYSL